MQHQKPSEPDRQAKIVSLQAAKKKKTAHRHWGALLVEVRRDANVTLREIAEAFERYRSRPVLADLGLYLPQKLGEIKGITDKQYGKWERNEVAPKFNQLLSLYLAMTAGCGIEITPDERDEFLELAQEKIASKKYQYRENLSSSDWLWLREQIYKSDGEQRYRQVEEREAFQPLQSEDNNGQKAQKEQQGKETDEHSEDEFLLPDTSHIVGRDEIANILLSYLQPSLLGKPRIKVAVIQGVTGSGKSSVLKLLHKQITESSHDFEIHQHEFDTNSKNVTPIEYLDTFLARLLNWLEIPLPETAKLPPLEKRIDRAIKQMGKTKKRLVLMLDDFQVTLDQDGKLAGDWRRFLTAFCQGDHTATLYIASREWNTWSLGKSPYVTEHKLDFLSPEAGIQIWRNLGFEEDENLLALATEKCGGHPGMIEMVARHLQQPPMSFGWGKEMLLDSPTGYATR
jgi:transcriptional regulator with XRE-family HTH domain